MYAEHDVKERLNNLRHFFKKVVYLSKVNILSIIIWFLTDLQ